MRLTKISTKTGDDGYTLHNGVRIPKVSPAIIAMGKVDSLNVQVGLLRLSINEYLLESIQHVLFDIGADLYGIEKFDKDDLKTLEERILQLNANLGPLKEFVIPFGSPTTMQAHVCRTICREAEIAVLQMDSRQIVRQYMNRLSDYFFLLARGSDEELWNNKNGSN